MLTPLLARPSDVSVRGSLCRRRLETDPLASARGSHSGVVGTLLCQSSQPSRASLAVVRPIAPERIADHDDVFCRKSAQGAARFNRVLRGGARLQIWIGLDGQAFQPRNPSEVVGVRGYRTFRQVLWNGPGELDLGIRARLPFRVFALDGPGSGSRLVIDVAHRW